MAWHEISIEAQSRAISHVVIGHQTLAGWPWTSWIPKGSPVIIVADERVQPVAQSVQTRLGAEDVKTLLWTVTIPEQDKNLQTVNTLYQRMGESQVTRDTVVIAVGGGVLTDLVGYVAATYLRGLRWIAIPTTLLAQVDAAIGGKVAVNTAFGKNLVGAFHLPSIVGIDTAVLETLPLREWQAGVGEVLKSALIAGPPLSDALSSELPPLGTMNDWWAAVIGETAALKARIVSEDLYERNTRMFLNFGHTVAHALENYFGYGTLTHGEAVGLGTLVALDLSEKVLNMPRWVEEQARTWMARWTLPSRAPAFDSQKLMGIMAQDKKARAFGLQWVLLADIGKPQVVTSVPTDVVLDSLQVIQP
ncbi:MAG: 3-dehydroquinate synthase [Sulfobacillus thermosulfidooxidans]|nr:3-dehydroquinate synthase [Sulfobacillus thermotolerans]PSR36015.1 MAG: 3-dehydroquinate synthase [Sulfobacillus thermosulfidooxidans]